jgi:hypothetical protein
MSNAAFVLIAIGLSVVVSFLIWLVSRKPQTFMSSIDDFEREMKALGHGDGSAGGRHRRRLRSQPRGSKTAGPAQADTIADSTGTTEAESPKPTEAGASEEPRS